MVDRVATAIQHPHRRHSRRLPGPHHGDRHLPDGHLRADRADHPRGAPADGETVTATATGELTLHGSIPVTFADYGIANPSFGPVTTEDNGEVEFLLALTRG